MISFYEKHKAILKIHGLTNNLRIAHFLAQIEHESGLKPIAENLNYSSEGLVKTFKKYFPTITYAKLFERQPQKIANKVYANRMGNGLESSGDGFKYRGRGFIQITGKSNYQELSKYTGIDFVNNPDLLLLESNSLLSALWFWNKNKLSVLADKDDILAITKKINGGTNGLEHRKILLAKWKRLIN